MLGGGCWEEGRVSSHWRGYGWQLVEENFRGAEFSANVCGAPAVRPSWMLGPNSCLLEPSAWWEMCLQQAQNDGGGATAGRAQQAAVTEGLGSEV